MSGTNRLAVPPASLDAMELAGLPRDVKVAALVARPAVARVLADLLDESIADEDATDVRVRLYQALRTHGGDR